MVEFKNSRDKNQLRMMGISFIREAIGLLSPESEAELNKFESNGLKWREYLIFRLNGQELPTEFIKLAVVKRWQEDQTKQEQFIQNILQEWGLLDD